MIIALTSDRGLCGAVHTNVSKRIKSMLGEVADTSDMKVLCIGDKSRAMLQRLAFFYFIYVYYIYLLLH